MPYDEWTDRSLTILDSERLLLLALRKCTSNNQRQSPTDRNARDSSTTASPNLSYSNVDFKCQLCLLFRSQLYNIMEEKKNALKNASAHCGTMDGSDARCPRWIAKSVQQT
ncbi:conserved hypothetical protein [Trichinella spiralis]|uniref:hypothetical protein n=1 Tax=Trichinella spiralis TaxID=6334 RepID=UPI0001EFC155|nr:conserved hypothetical protein [Trichinella spiralis]